MPPTHILVTAPEGRLCPIHPSDGGDDAGGLLYVMHGRVTRVKYSQDVRRSIKDGDLIPCTRDGKPAKDLEAAACNQPLPSGSPHVTDDDHKPAAPAPAKREGSDR
jgi:hypothetical protein